MCVPQQLAGVEGERRVSVWGFSSFEGKTPKGYQDISIKVLQKKKFLPFEFPSISRPTLSRLPEKKSGEPNKKITHRKRENQGKSDRALTAELEKNLRTLGVVVVAFAYILIWKQKFGIKYQTERETYYLSLILRHLSGLLSAGFWWREEQTRNSKKKNSREIFQKW